MHELAGLLCLFQKLWNKTKTFSICLRVFTTKKAEGFCIIQKLCNEKNVFLHFFYGQQNVSISLNQKIYGSQISQDKTEFFVNSTKILKQKIWAERKRCCSIISFVSKTNILYIFWDDSRKTKAFNLEKILVWQYPAPVFCWWLIV
jgi:hypothetical protein